MPKLLYNFNKMHYVEFCEPFEFKLFLIFPTTEQFIQISIIN